MAETVGGARGKIGRWDPPLRAGGSHPCIIVTYPKRELDPAGWHVQGTGIYLGLSIAFAIALARPFGIIL